MLTSFCIWGDLHSVLARFVDCWFIGGANSISFGDTSDLSPIQAIQYNAVLYTTTTTINQNQQRTCCTKASNLASLLLSWGSPSQSPFVSLRSSHKLLLSKSLPGNEFLFGSTLSKSPRRCEVPGICSLHSKLLQKVLLGFSAPSRY